MHQPVSPSRWQFRRVKAILLLAVFLSAGTSLPSLDALAYHHGVGDLNRSQSHVEPAGGCLEHGEHCTLGRTASGSGADITPITAVTVEPASRPDRPATGQSLFSVDPTGNPHSRAPPVLLA